MREISRVLLLSFSGQSDGLKTAGEKFALDRAFPLIEGHPVLCGPPANPPLQSSQGWGTHLSGMGIERSKAWATRPAIPGRVALQQSPPALHRPASECATVILPVDGLLANGKLCLNCLCQPRGQPHTSSDCHPSKAVDEAHDPKLPQHCVPSALKGHRNPGYRRVAATRKFPVCSADVSEMAKCSCEHLLVYNLPAFQPPFQVRGLAP